MGSSEPCTMPETSRASLAGLRSSAAPRPRRVASKGTRAEGGGRRQGCARGAPAGAPPTPRGRRQGARQGAAPASPQPSQRRAGPRPRALTVDGASAVQVHEARTWARFGVGRREAQRRPGCCARGGSRSKLTPGPSARPGAAPTPAAAPRWRGASEPPGEHSGFGGARPITRVLGELRGADALGNLVGRDLDAEA
jgi:hypothetical protein